MDKQLLIIGNGFDLYCGLKSRYSDFYKAKIEGKFNYLSLRNKNSFEVFDYLHNVQPHNFWHTLLWYYDDNHGNYGWCAIEEIIKETLNTIYKNDIIKTAWDNCKYFLINKIYNNNATDFKLAFMKEYFFRYIYNLFEKNASYTRMVSCPIQERNNIYFHLFKELNSLERLFCEYLKEETELNKESYMLNATNLLIKLTDVGLNTIEDLDAINKSTKFYFRDVNILSFNYTTPFININKQRLGTCNHVHGKLCEKDCQECSSSTVIFGIDDKVVKPNEKVDNLNEYEDFRFFSKTYRTLFSDANKISALPKNDNSPLTIKFFGHSLNEADYSYFQSIFDYYSIYDNSNVSLVFYYTPFKPEAKNEIIDSVYKLINQYGLTLNNKDQGQNLMHKLILEKRVKIKEIEPLTPTV